MDVDDIKKQLNKTVFDHMKFHVSASSQVTESHDYKTSMTSLKKILLGFNPQRGNQMWRDTESNRTTSKGQLKKIVQKNENNFDEKVQDEMKNWLHENDITQTNKQIETKYIEIISDKFDDFSIPRNQGRILSNMCKSELRKMCVLNCLKQMSKYRN